MNLNTRYPLVPLRDIVVLQHSVIPLFLGRPASVMAVEHAIRTSSEVVFALQSDPEIDQPGEHNLCNFGTLGHIG